MEGQLSEDADLADVDELLVNGKEQEIGEDRTTEDDGSTPKLGMTFKSVEEAYEYYRQYGLRMGFKVVKRSSKSREDGQFDTMVLACDKWGKRKPRLPNGIAYRIRKTKKTNCKAKMVVRFRDDGLYHLEYLIVDHNHDSGSSKSALSKAFKVSAGVAPTTSTSTPFVCEEVAKDLATIEQISRALIAVGFPANLFTQESFLHQGFLTSEQFSGYLRILTGHTEPAKLERVIDAATANQVITGIRNLTFAQLISFLSWLKTPTGKEAIARASLELKLMKSGKGSFSTKQVAWVEAFKLFREEYLLTVKERRQRMESSIKELVTQIQKEQESFENDSAIYRNQFHPVSAFESLPVQTLNRRCWELRCAQAEAAGESAPTLSLKSMEDAIELFRDEVNSEHKLQFVHVGDNLACIRAWVECKLRLFQRSREEVSVARYRRLLEAIGGIQAGGYVPFPGMPPTMVGFGTPPFFSVTAPH